MIIPPRFEGTSFANYFAKAEAIQSKIDSFFLTAPPIQALLGVEGSSYRSPDERGHPTVHIAPGRMVGLGEFVNIMA